jgi:uncharacterized membrane protein YfcA
MTEYFFTFLIGFAGSTISGIAGAGAGLLTSPYLILLGLPPHVAVATAKLGGVGLTVGSLGKFSHTKHVRREYIIPFIAVSLGAGLTGAQLLLALNTEIVRYVGAGGMVLALPLLFLKRIGLERQETTKTRRTVGYGLKFGAESIQAAFGSGLGVLTSLVMMFFFGMTAIETNATKRLPGLIKELVVLPTFMLAGVMSYDHGVALLLGSLVGGYAGAHLAVKGGNMFVKVVLALVVAAMAVKLFVT